MIHSPIESNASEVTENKSAETKQFFPFGSKSNVLHAGKRLWPHRSDLIEVHEMLSYVIECVGRKSG